MKRVSLIVLMVLVTGRINNIFGCTLSDEDGAGMAINLMLRMGDLIGSKIPIVGQITGVLWIFSDVSSGDQDLTSQMECYAYKYLREYHMDRLTIIIKNLNSKFNDAKRDKTKLMDLLDEIEHVGVISLIQSNIENTQAAIHPTIAPWSVLHLAVYKQLISLNTNYKKEQLKKKSDKWLLFYARLMLRYHRAHKYKMIQDTSMTWASLKSSKINKSPAELVKPWLKLASNSSTRTEMTNMIDSCKLTSGDTVQFKLVYKAYNQNIILGRLREKTVVKHLDDNKFFSCSDNFLARRSKYYCTWRNCPKENIFSHSREYSRSSYQDHWACRGETFWIYADQKTINHNTVVNIKYNIDTEDTRGFWVSSKGTMGGNTDKNWEGDKSITRICPGKLFTHIKSDCGSENFKILKLATSTDKGIYDGSFVEIGENVQNPKYVYDLYRYGSESLKKDRISAPLG